MTRWTWVWASSGSWWWTGKPGMLQSMGSERVGHGWVTKLNWEDPVEKEMGSHSSILAWRIPWTEEPGGLQSMGLQRVGHDRRDLACIHANQTKIYGVFSVCQAVLFVSNIDSLFNPHITFWSECSCFTDREIGGGVRKLSGVLVLIGLDRHSFPTSSYYKWKEKAGKTHKIHLHVS